MRDKLSEKCQVRNSQSFGGQSTLLQSNISVTSLNFFIPAGFESKMMDLKYQRVRKQVAILKSWFQTFSTELLHIEMENYEHPLNICCCFRSILKEARLG